jgi:AmmeMemoRadiSam system protein B
MTAVREPAVAGLFYPDDRESLSFTVDQLMAEKVSRGPVPKALIVPHAGYPFSGDVAASAYARIRAHAGRISRVVVLGPAHRVPFRGIAAPSVELFATPLGRVALDRIAIDELLELPQVIEMDMAHEAEHSLEVQLPFLQRLLGTFELVPLVVGESSPRQVGEVLERLWGGGETLILISSDLSHYLDYDTASERDAATAGHIERLEHDAIGHEDACGRNPINGLLWLARERGMRVEQLSYRNSGDTAGDKRRVVGYGAFAVYDAPG